MNKKVKKNVSDCDLEDLLILDLNSFRCTLYHWHNWPSNGSSSSHLTERHSRSQITMCVRMGYRKKIM